MGGWGCPHEANGKCQKIHNLPCDPGMKGCVLFGRFVWADQSKNRPTGGWSGNSTPAPEVEPNGDELCQPDRKDDATAACRDSSDPQDQKPV